MDSLPDMNSNDTTQHIAESSILRSKDRRLPEFSKIRAGKLRARMISIPPKSSAKMQKSVELKVDSGWVQKESTKINFEKSGDLGDLLYTKRRLGSSLAALHKFSSSVMMIEAERFTDHLIHF